MKTIFTLCLWALATTAAFCQADSIKYLNEKFEPVPQSEATYYRVSKITNAITGQGYQEEFFVTGEKYSETHYSKTDSVKDGWKLIWFKNGQLGIKEFYVKNKLHGPVEKWLEDGTLLWELTYQKDLLHDTIKTYYPNRQLKRRDVYSAGKFVMGQCFNEKGTPISHFAFEEMPEFPGGLNAMFNFLGNSMQIPKDMRKARQNGKVVLSFLVAKDGSIGNIEVVTSTHESLTANAMKVLQAMPRWKPGKQDGEPVPVKYTVPIAIKLN